jgi:hypothetical protein
LQDKGILDPVLVRSPEDEILAERGVKAAFDLTWQTLEAEAQRVERLLSYFALDWIDWNWVVTMLQRLEGDGYTSGGLKARLENASLVQFEEDRPGWCRLHPLIWQYLREVEPVAAQELNAAVLYSAFVTKMVAFASQMPQTPTTKDIEWFQSVLLHVRAVAERFTEGLEGDKLTWPFIALGRFYNEQGLYRESVSQRASIQKRGNRDSDCRVRLLPIYLCLQLFSCRDISVVFLKEISLTPAYT